MEGKPQYSNLISAGESDNRWVEYDLSEVQLLFKERESNWKAIVRKGKLVTVVSDGYTLLPNEEAVKIADAEAMRCGLVPFNEFKGDWIARMNEHVIYSRDATRVHALYALNEAYRVNGEEMFLGVGVHNGIDGHEGFHCGIFTFRTACSNMVMAGMPRYGRSFDSRRMLEYVNRSHTKGLNPELPKLRNAILSMMERAGMIIEAYEEMALQKVTEDLIEKIRKSKLPKKVWPDVLQEVEDSVKIEAPDMSQWDFYNAITAKVWHNDLMDVTGKISLFGTLHRIMPLVR